jgi:DNA-binding transcriptional LysR family regulator
MTIDRSIPIDLLKTFLVLLENHSFSKTAEQVGRSQSAISLQMKRLQDIAGSPLFTSSGKSLSLTQQGEVLFDYARQIVKLNDECINRLDGNLLTGTIRIGIPSDFAITFLPRILGRFTEANPNIALDVKCDLSAELTRMIDDRDCDLVLALDDGHPSRYLAKLWREPVAWVGWKTHEVYKTRPLPLVLYPERCQYRARIIQTLGRKGIPYRIVYSSSNMAGNHAAIQAGLGVTALSKSTIPPYLYELPITKFLPPLDSVDVGFYWNPRGATKATQELAEFLVGILDRKLTPLPKHARMSTKAEQ